MAPMLVLGLFLFKVKNGSSQFDSLCKLGFRNGASLLINLETLGIYRERISVVQILIFQRQSRAFQTLGIRITPTLLLNTNLKFT